MSEETDRHPHLYESWCCLREKTMNIRLTVVLAAVLFLSVVADSQDVIEQEPIDIYGEKKKTDMSEQVQSKGEQQQDHPSSTQSRQSYPSAVTTPTSVPDTYGDARINTLAVRENRLRRELSSLEEEYKVIETERREWTSNCIKTILQNYYKDVPTVKQMYSICSAVYEEFNTEEAKKSAEERCKTEKEKLARLEQKALSFTNLSMKEDALRIGRDNEELRVFFGRSMKYKMEMDERGNAIKRKQQEVDSACDATRAMQDKVTKMVEAAINANNIAIEEANRAADEAERRRRKELKVGGGSKSAGTLK